MITETLELLTSWLNDPTYGAAAMCAQVPLKAGDPALAAFSAFQETSDEDVATLDGSTAAIPGIGLSALLVTEAPDAAAEDIGDGLIAVRMRFFTRDRNLLNATRAGAYSMRGVLWSLRKLHRGGNESARQLRGIMLTKMHKLDLASLYQKTGDSWCSAQLVVTELYRDVQLQL